MPKFKAEHMEALREMAEALRDRAEALIDAADQFDSAADEETAADRREARDEAVAQVWAEINEYEPEAAAVAEWIEKNAERD